MKFRETLIESHDGKCHVKILADSNKAAKLAEFVEIVAKGETLTVRVDKKSRSSWGISGGGFHGLSIELALPQVSNVRIKTVSGDIAAHIFSGCDYKLKSISGNIKVHVAPDLAVEVDGNSISGELNSEISLNESSSESEGNGKVVGIAISTISGDFNLVRI